MFGKIFTILGVATVAVSAFEFDFQKELANNQQELQKFGEFLEGFGDVANDTLSQLESNKREYKIQLAKIIERAAYEAELNYARTIEPVAQDYADFLKTLEVNQNCNETCIV